MASLNSELASNSLDMDSWVLLMICASNTTSLVFSNLSLILPSLCMSSQVCMILWTARHVSLANCVPMLLSVLMGCGQNKHIHNSTYPFEIHSTHLCLQYHRTNAYIAACDLWIDVVNLMHSFRYDLVAATKKHKY